MRKMLLAAVLPLLLMSACTKTNTAGAPQPHATVLMRDGTSVSGSVQSSSPTELVLAGDDNISHTIPMNTVKSVEYDDTQPAPMADTSSAPPSSAPQSSMASLPDHENHYHPMGSVIQTKTYRLGEGTELSVRTEETIDSGRAAEGQTYAAEVTRDARDASGAVVIPRGSNAQIVIRSASGGGRIRGASDLVLDLQSVSVDGQEYQLSTTDLAQRGNDGVGANRRTAEYSGGGGAIGAIIGAIAGGGKGAAIGAGAGAGAGALTQILTKGSIKIPVETVLTFKLDKPLRVIAAN